MGQLPGTVTAATMAETSATSAAATRSGATATPMGREAIPTNVSSPWFEAGDDVVVRYITRAGSRVGMTWPFKVVRDDAESTALYIPAGSTFMRWAYGSDGSRELAEGEWRRSVLRLMYPGLGYSVWLFWEGEPHRFTTYYINFEEPFRRTPVGFRTHDHTLDIVVQPNLSWQWKDRPEFEALVAQGHFGAEFAVSVEQAAEDALARLTRSDPPFDGSWCDWEPPGHWLRPKLHPSWRTEPAVPWERRAWAYPAAAG